jgi:hypothetical protein
MCEANVNTVCKWLEDCDESVRKKTDLDIEKIIRIIGLLKEIFELNDPEVFSWYFKLCQDALKDGCSRAELLYCLQAQETKYADFLLTKRERDLKASREAVLA